MNLILELIYISKLRDSSFFLLDNANFWVQDFKLSRLVRRISRKAVIRENTFGVSVVSDLQSVVNEIREKRV